MTLTQIITAKPNNPPTTITPSTSVLGDITNFITPPRALQWTSGVTTALASLPKGMNACAIVVGEDEEGSLLLLEMRGLKEFKMRLGKRELITSVSSLPLSLKTLFSV